MKFLLSLVLFFTVTLSLCYAQEKGVVQVSGIVYNADSNSVVPYVTVTNKSGRSEFSANYQGYFSFVAQEQDTISFSAIGYKRQLIVVPSNVKDKKYTVLVRLKPEFINLPVVKVYPWASIDEFNRDFMNIKLADDDLELAKKNVSRSSILAMSKTLSRDGGEMSTMNFQNNFSLMSNKHTNQRANNPLLNPFAWAAFMQQITQGDKSRKSTD